MTRRTGSTGNERPVSQLLAIRGTVLLVALLALYIPFHSVSLLIAGTRSADRFRYMKGNLLSVESLSRSRDLIISIKSGSGLDKFRLHCRSLDIPVGSVIEVAWRNDITELFGQRVAGSVAFDGKIYCKARGNFAPGGNASWASAMIMSAIYAGIAWLLLKMAFSRQDLE